MTFVSASCTIRYAATSTSAVTGRGAPSLVSIPLGVRYLLGLLWFQGIVWALLAAVGLAAWAANLAGTTATNNTGRAVLSAGAELLAIILAAGCATAEVGLARHLRGGRKLVLAAAIGAEGFMLCLGIVVAAVLLMTGGGLAAFVALGGPVLSTGGLMVLADQSVRRYLADSRSARRHDGI
jgi:hypothetical protein